MPSKIITEELKNEVREYYLSQPMTMKNVSEYFHLSQPTISKILKDIPKYSRAKINNPSLKENFFQNINSEEQAYFLGLMIADGNVFKEKDGGRQASISITLKLEDEYILLKFKEALNSSTNIGYDGRGCGQLAVRSNIMAKDLEQYGIIPRKTNLTYLPLIDRQWMSHLIRGIFDGDGSILAKPSPNNDGHNRYLHNISFCGTHELMQNISDYLIQELSLKQKPTVYDYKDRNLSELKIQNIEDIYTFGEWMYQDSNIFLIRKQEIYNSFKNHYNLD